MGIGSYRSNEVHHPLAALMNEMKEKVCDNVETIELSELSKTSIYEFICDTLGITIEEEDDIDIAGGASSPSNTTTTSCRIMKDLSDVIYDKTLGNIFFTIQSIEQLVRNNILYYDTMMFHWTFHNQMATKYESLSDHLSDDISDMIINKINSLSSSQNHYH